jgi:prevent-host-death family protein
MTIFPMQHIGIAKAKASFEKILARAESGEVVTLTRHGHPAAQLVPLNTRRQQLAAEWRKRVKNVRLNRPGLPKLTIKELIEEGRK